MGKTWLGPDLRDSELLAILLVCFKATPDFNINHIKSPY